MLWLSDLGGNRRLCRGSNTDHYYLNCDQGSGILVPQLYSPPLQRLFSSMFLPEIQGPSLSDSTATFSCDSRWPCSKVILLIAPRMHVFVHSSLCSSFISLLIIHSLLLYWEPTIAGLWKHKGKQDPVPSWTGFYSWTVVPTPWHK